MIYGFKISPQNRTKAETISSDVELKFSNPASPGCRPRLVRGYEYLMLDWPAEWGLARPITMRSQAAHVDSSHGSRVTSHYFSGGGMESDARTTISAQESNGHGLSSRAILVALVFLGWLVGMSKRV